MVLALPLLAKASLAKTLLAAFRALRFDDFVGDLDGGSKRGSEKSLIVRAAGQTLCIVPWLEWFHDPADLLLLVGLAASCSTRGDDALEEASSHNDPSVEVVTPDAVDAEAVHSDISAQHMSLSPESACAICSACILVVLVLLSAARDS